ncbi:MAG: xanthine dehydrogenase family protein molybdopterin-binding subunit, partial [Desulfobulbia bacterium]
LEVSILNKLSKIGVSTRRKEDERLLTGRGQYSDDYKLPGQCYAIIIRSEIAHGVIKKINLETALELPGVLAIYTGRDCVADNLNPIPHSPVPSTRNDVKLRGPGDQDVIINPHHLLPLKHVRYVGEAVAMIIAESEEEALDAAEAVEITYESLPWTTDALEALNPEAPFLWNTPTKNLCVDRTFGDREETDRIFENADHKFRMAIHVGRVTGVPLEPRSALADYDKQTGRYTLYAGSGGSVRHKRELSATLNLNPDDLRIICRDVGGNFGTRNRVYVEFGLVLWASKKLERPVKYTCRRSEALISDYQGRDLHTTVELAVNSSGKFLAMRASNVSNIGAHMVSLSPLGKGTALITGNYDIPYAYVRARAVHTNTVPTQAYRSSGRPEVTFALERLLDQTARQLGMDAYELRRKNLIPPDSMPYRNPIGAVYDSGEYALSMTKARALSDWDGFHDRRKEAEKSDLLLGRSIVNYVESSTGSPIEQTEIKINPGGHIDVVIGTQPSGQGHETSFAQVAAEWLGVSVDSVNIVIGDTDIVNVGGGSHSGRSMRMAGTVIVLACEELIDNGKALAAHIFGRSKSEIEFRDGVFSLVKSNRTIDFFELAKRAEQENLPDELSGGLTVTRQNEMHTQVFPNGCHICEMLVDPKTGFCRILKYVAVDDVGRAINPLIVDGQTHGGIVQGVGQAMWEQIYVDPGSGQPLTGSLMDYALPRADEIPNFLTELNEVHSPTNPLGIKAGGEGGTTGALATIINAIVDALYPLGVEDISMPATPFRVWQAIQAADNSTHD